MEKKVKEKRMEIEGRQFIIRKFSAYVGSYVTFLLSSKLIPLGLSGNMADMSSMLQNLSSIGLSRAEFADLQKDCLEVCFEVVNGMEIPVLNENGSFRAIGLEEDFPTVVKLTVQAVAFNAQSFFGGRNLEDLMPGFSAMKSTGVQT